VHICANQFKKTYHCNKVIVSVRVLFKPQDNLWKAGVELHNPVEVLLIILVDSALVVSIYLSSSDRSVLIWVLTRQRGTHGAMEIHKRADGAWDPSRDALERF
jgi:hypothetical protein